MSEKRRKKVDLKTKTHPLVNVFLIIVSLIQVFPLYWMFTFSLKDNKEIFGANTIGLPQVWRWDNYEKVFSKANMGTYLMNSVIITAITIFFTLLLSAMATYAIVRMKWKLSKFVYNTFLIGMMLSIHAVLLPLYLNKDDIRVAKPHLEELARYLGIEHLLSRFPDQMSGGERQRVAIARSMLHEPLVLMLDEPTGSLDNRSTLEVMELLCRINKERNVTVVQVTHSEEAAAFGSRIVRLSDGEVLAE